MAKIQKNLKLTEQDIGALDAKRGSVPFQTYVEALIRRDLYGEVPAEERTVKEEMELLENKKSLDKLLDDALLKEALRDPAALLAGMDQKQKTDLMLKRLPKVQGVDVELEQQAISLKECLEMMPGMDDISKEVSKAKNARAKAELQLEMEKSVVLVLKRKLKKTLDWQNLKDFLDEAGRMMNRYAKDCDVREIDYTPIKLIAVQKGVINDPNA